jgi:gamma-aminobutyric acid type B receptor
LNLPLYQSNSYFLGYEFDAILTLTYAFERLERSLTKINCSNEFSLDTVWRQSCWRKELLNIIQKLDIQGVTGRVRFVNGDRIGEIVIEQILGRLELNKTSCRWITQ